MASRSTRASFPLIQPVPRQMTCSGAQQSLGSKAGLPVPKATGPVLRDDPQVVSAMALPPSFVPDGKSTGAAVRHRATALGVLHAQMSTAHPGEGTDLARCLRALWAAEHPSSRRQRPARLYMPTYGP